jgi:hemolysin III
VHILLGSAPTLPFLFRNPVSSASHFLWCAFALFAGAFLVRLSRGNRLKAVSLAIFTASMVVLYFASGLYHALRLPMDSEALHWFRLFDHSAIYLLIAGSYTPFVVVLLRGRGRVILLSAVWGLALLGIASKWLIAMPPYPVTVGIYIAMGWVGVIQLPALIRAMGLRGMGLVLLGGVFYMIGGISDALRWPDIWPGIVGPHEILHLSDMVGTGIHILVMLHFVVPYPMLDPAVTSAVVPTPVLPG